MHRVCAMLCCLLLLGGHMAILQGCAWTGMLYQRLATAQPLAQAWNETFAGDHPCGLCLTVQELQDQTDAPLAPSDKQVKKSDKMLFVRLVWPTPMSTALHREPQAQLSPNSHAPEVETPPPRV